MTEFEKAKEEFGTTYELTVIYEQTHQDTDLLIAEASRRITNLKEENHKLNNDIIQLLENKINGPNNLEYSKELMLTYLKILMNMSEIYLNGQR